jgi:hypothetical protein
MIFLPALHGWAQHQMDRSGPPPFTINDVFAQIGAQVPEFGGMFVDADKDTLYIYVVGGRAALVPQLDLALTGVLGSDRPHQSRIEVLEAQYSFRDLKAWHDVLTPRVLSLKGAVFTGIDQRNNRIEVGIQRLGLAPQVLVLLQQFGVPRDAVNISVTPPANPRKPTLAPSDESANQQPPVITLRSKIRPLVGGIQISRRDPDNVLKYCTLGFYAVRRTSQEASRGFVTNSHCTNVQGGVEDTNYWQPSPPDLNGIGIEAVDPCYWWWAGGAYPMEDPPCESPPHNPPYPLWCPEDHACRLSDSAFVRLQVAALGGDIRFRNGFIARPTNEDTINWDPPNTFFRIVGERTYLNVGDLVSKVGQSTGWTRGMITRVCVNLNVVDEDYTLICQNQSDLDLSNGDSGAAVFQCLGNTGPVDCRNAPVTDNSIDVNLVGLVWGGEGTFSPIGSRSDDTVTGVQNGAHELDTMFQKCGVGRC